MGSPAPTIQQWQRLWQLWDAAMLVMVPPEHHCDRPLELRQPFIFYIGHLPAFTDARLAKVLQQQLTEPAHYADMFARGIDPDLDDPTQCHPHSPTPPQWPSLADILAYRDRVRVRIVHLYSGGSSSSNGHAAAAGDAVARCCCDTSRQQQHTYDSRCSKADSCCSCQGQSPHEQAAVIAALPADVQQVLWMSYEHEAMHLETLMYLLVQYEAVQPPPAEVLAAAVVPAVAWRSDLSAAAAGIAAHGNARNNSSSASSSIANGSAESADLSAASKVGSTARQLLPQQPAAAWVEIPPSSVTLGFDQHPSSSSSSSSSSGGTAASNDSSSSSCSSSRGRGRDKLLQFGWDNECPARQVSVAGLKIQHRPVTVLEYLHFLACKMADSCTAAGEPQAVNGPCSLHARSVVVEAAPAGAEDELNTGRLGEKFFTTQYGSSAQQDCSSRSSMALPPLLAELQNSQQAACNGCQQAVSGLLRQKAAQALLPASLALLPQGGPIGGAQDTGSISNGGSRCQQLLAADSMSGKLSVRFGCVGLCQSQKPASHCNSSSSSTGGTVQTAHLQGLHDAVCDALQQHLGFKTVFGLAPISIAGYWPVYCSAVQAEQYAAWASTPAHTYRLPMEPEILAARQYNRTLVQSGCASTAGQQFQHGSAVTAASGTYSAGVDFAAWHPLCVHLLPGTPGSPRSSSSVSRVPHADDGYTGSSSTASTTDGTTAAGSPVGGQAVSQLCDNGWEWTCSVFDRHEGFEAHPMYPGYSQDFFGGKHVVLLGGSWATLSSIAGRQTFRNWYQKGQQHVFGKFRLVHV